MSVSRLSIIVAARNAAAHLPTLLSSLAADQDANREIIVCDDASSDATAAVAAAGGARVIGWPHNLGPAAARNRGAMASTGNILVFLDADSTVCTGFSAAVRERIDDGSHEACICGMNLSGIRLRSFATQFKTIEWFLLRNLDRTQHNCFSGNGAAIRRDVFFASNGFNETFRTPGVEDFDLAMRLPATVRVWCSGREVLVHAFGSPAVEFRSTVIRAWQFACLPMRQESTYSRQRRLSVAAAALTVLSLLLVPCFSPAALLAVMAAGAYFVAYREFYKRALNCVGAWFLLRAAVYGLLVDATAGMAFGLGRIWRVLGTNEYRFSSLLATVAGAQSA